VQFRVAACTTVPSRRQGDTGKSGAPCRSWWVTGIRGGVFGYEEGLNGWRISRRSLHGEWFTGRPSSGRCSPLGRQFSIVSRQGWTWIPQARAHTHVQHTLTHTHSYIHTYVRTYVRTNARTHARADSSERGGSSRATMSESRLSRLITTHR